MKKILTENTLRLQKLAGIINESQFNEQINEGWRENILGAVMAATSMLGSVKGQGSTAPINPGTTQTQSLNSLTVPMGTLFQSGKYLFKDADQKAISVKLKQIGEFIAKNPNANFSVSIESSESQVPNYDAETSTRIKLEPGQLATKRAEVAKFTIETFVENLKKDGLLKGGVNVSEPKINIGKTPYVQGEDQRSDKFTREQYVNVVISLVSATKTATTAPYKVSSQETFRYYDGANHAIADGFYASRSSNNIAVSGNINTGYTDILIKWLDRNGNETGEKNLVPSDWWNTNIGQHTQLSPEMIQGIKSQPKG